MASPQPTDPYAPPQADLELSADSARLIRRLGKHIVVPRDVPLPQRCVKCNGEGDGIRITPRLYYYHWSVMLAVVVLLLLVWPLALVVALVGRRSARVDLSLCKRHQRRRRIMAGVAVAFLTLSLVAPWIGFMTPAIDHDLTIGAGIVAFVTGLVITAVRGQPLRIARIRDNTLHLSGTGEAFRAAFEDLQTGSDPGV